MKIIVENRGNETRKFLVCDVSKFVLSFYFLKEMNNVCFILYINLVNIKRSMKEAYVKLPETRAVDCPVLK